MKNGTILDRDGIAKAIDRLAHEIIEQHADLARVALIGIKTRGDLLARRLASRIESFSGAAVPCGALDITFYRDDVASASAQPIMHATEIDFDIARREIVLVDDVLFTGRTIRCALDALVDFGRPAKIELAVLIDRGHRELPIRADYVGKNIPTSKDDDIKVALVETDGTDEVRLEDDHG